MDISVLISQRSVEGNTGIEDLIGKSQFSNLTGFFSLKDFGQKRQKTLSEVLTGIKRKLRRHVFNWVVKDSLWWAFVVILPGSYIRSIDQKGIIYSGEFIQKFYGSLEVAGHIADGQKSKSFFELTFELFGTDQSWELLLPINAVAQNWDVFQIGFLKHSFVILWVFIVVLFVELPIRVSVGNKMLLSKINNKNFMSENLLIFLIISKESLQLLWSNSFEGKFLENLHGSGGRPACSCYPNNKGTDLLWQSLGLDLFSNFSQLLIGILHSQIGVGLSYIDEGSG